MMDYSFYNRDYLMLRYILNTVPAGTFPDIDNDVYEKAVLGRNEELIRLLQSRIPAQAREEYKYKY